MGRRLALVAVLLAALAAPIARAAAPSTPAPVLSGALLLDRLTNPVGAAAPLPAGVRLVEFSSHDRSGGNGDGGTFDPVTEQRGSPQWLRRDGNKYVLLDIDQPGCLTRMWFTGLDPNEGGISDFGTLDFTIDGGEPVGIDITDLFSGTRPDFPAPLVNNYTVSSGGNYSYVPICFSTSLVIDADRAEPGLGFYQLDALVAPHGTPVEAWSEGTDLTGTAAKLAGAGAPPPTAPSAHVVGTSPSVDLRRAGTVQYLRIGATPFTIETLRSTWLTVTADGADAPQIHVPLAALFGDGREVRTIHTPAFGMDPNPDGTGTGYLALPIPFSRGTHIAVSGATTDVTLDVWRGAPTAGADRLYGAYSSETTQLGRDYTVLDASGAGHLVAWVLDIIGQQQSAKTTQSYMEGDMRMFIDGSRSPTVYGTGTEDEFNGGFYYANGQFSLPTHGAGPVGKEGDRSTESQYRIFSTDSPAWSSKIELKMEHGASDEDTRQVFNTTWSYRRPSNAGFFAPVDVSTLVGTPSTLSSFFEGDQDGSLTQPLLPLGLTSTVAAPAQVNDEAWTFSGITFSAPITVSVTVPARARCALIVRRLRDAGATSDLQVSVDGFTGRWWDAYWNATKRWEESDFRVPASVVTGNSVKLTLKPNAGAETLYGLQTGYDCG